MNKAMRYAHKVNTLARELPYKLAAKAAMSGGVLMTSGLAMADDTTTSSIDISSIETLIAEGVVAATTIGVAVLGLTAGIKIYKMLKSAA